MAKATSFTVLMAIILLQTLIPSPVLAQEEISPSPEEGFYAPTPATEYDDHLVHTLPKSYLEFIQGCTNKMNSKCAEQVFYHVLEKSKVSKTCCKNLLRMGLDCHVGLVKAIFSTYEYKANASYGVPRSKQVWNKCVLDVGAEIGSPVSFEDYHD